MRFESTLWPIGRADRSQPTTAGGNMTDQSSHSTDYDGVGHAATDARSGMTKTERAELVRIVRLNYKVARATVDQRQADVLADVEEQIATDWESHDKQWREACGETEDEIRDLNQRIRERFQELGLPGEDAPSVWVHNGKGGENGDRGRREELRRVARTRTAADAQKAQLGLDAAEAKMLTQLAAGALSSNEARAFLADVPEIGQLMPVLDLAQLRLMEGSGENLLPF
jgi:hypothetical protein